MSHLSNAERRSARPQVGAASLSSTRISRAYADWLRSVRWDHFTTLTFAAPVSAEAAASRLQRYVRHLETLAQQPVNYFASVEAGSLSDRVHLHALLWGTSTLTVARIGAAWRLGLATVRLFNSELDGVGYVTKSFDEDDYQFTIHDRRLMKT